ncbi:nucleotidyltransferase [Thermoanaerobacterium thermosaccharolyticum]|uniref:nucleotidyltransferase n=1 Tax=Thermoanaerobacterium thermosaccharolyticum TaxID=1517 RepID=UPI003D27AE5F
MSILGLIVEYNPLHNGHIYHIKRSIQKTSADFVVAVMSGNFVQRGTPSIIDKWSRTEAALLSGIDLVIELPVIYAVSTAENFAYGAVKLLDSLNIIDYISFGSEDGSIDKLYEVAKFLSEETEEYKIFLKNQLKRGMTYAKAREIALSKYLGSNIKNIMGNSNNILGIEYIKSLIKLNSSIKPVTIKRLGPGYNSMKTENTFASATYLRKAIISENYSELDKFMPKYSIEILKKCINEGHGPVTLNDYSKIITYLLRSNCKIEDIFDVTEGLQNRIKKASCLFNDIDKIINYIKTKRYTESRIRRILLHILLGIDSNIYSKYDGPNYIRVLGTNNNGIKLLKMIKNRSKLPIITKASDYKKILSDPCMFERDIIASDTYTLAYKNDSVTGLDFTKKFIVLE